jgi:sulfur carrier protein ThiS
MFVTVKLFGTVRRLSQPDTPGLWQGHIPPGSQIIDLIKILGTKENEIAAATINGEISPLDSTIPENATIVLVTPMGGG